MALSTNSIIHITSCIHNLKGILDNGFRLKYCLESVYGDEAAFPMVSFCDIPFSQIKNHLDNYGGYGIGLTKEWAQEKEINPVLYIYGNSHVYHIMKEYGESLTKEMHNAKTENERRLIDKWLSIHTPLVSFMKPYKGINSKGNSPGQFVYYDEREWRYVPTKETLDKNPHPKEGFSMNPVLWGPNYRNNKERYNEYISHIHLDFALKDLKYLIVKNESEVAELEKFVKEKFESELQTRPQLQLPHIFTRNQIFMDF